MFWTNDKLPRQDSVAKKYTRPLYPEEKDSNNIENKFRAYHYRHHHVIIVDHSLTKQDHWIPLQRICYVDQVRQSKYYNSAS